MRRHRSRLSREIFSTLRLMDLYKSVGRGCDTRESFYSIVPATLSSRGTQNIINLLIYIVLMHTRAQNIMIAITHKNC